MLRCHKIIGEVNGQAYFCQNNRCKRTKDSRYCCYHSEEADSWCDECLPCGGNYDGDFDEKRQVWQLYYLPTTEPKTYFKELPVSHWIGVLPDSSTYQCNVLLCPTLLIYTFKSDDEKTKPSKLVCPTCKSEYEEYYSFEVQTWVLRLVTKSAELSEREQRRNLDVMAGIINKEFDRLKTETVTQPQFVDDFMFEDKTIDNISIKYYPDIIRQLQMNPEQVVSTCSACSTAFDTSNLFMIHDLRVVCNLCLPFEILRVKAEEYMRVAEASRKKLATEY